MVEFRCDVCKKPVVAGKGFVVASGYNGTDVAIFKFPKASRLQEAHSHLTHVCGRPHLLRVLDIYLPGKS